ncbi:MAG: hypothetical protein ACC642_11560, partial [Pseudomonadales bacterium]
MKPRFFRIGYIATLILFLVSISAQAAAAKFEPQRTSWGTPDIQGVWDFRTLTPFERPPEFADKAVLTAEEAEAFRHNTLQVLDVDNRISEARIDVEAAYNTFWWDWGTELNEDRRTSLIIDPPNGRLPEIQPAAMARMKEHNLLRTPPVRDLFSLSAIPSPYLPTDPESLGLSERCLVGFNAGPPLTPSAYNNNLRIVQTPDHVVLVTEMIHDARIVPMNGRPHLPSEIRRWSGDSRGRWEGNTLVIETTNFTDKTPTMQLPVTLANIQESGGVGSGKNMLLIERITPVEEGRLLYEYTLNDP